MQSAVNKQFIEIENKPIIAHTLELFENCSEVDSILPVVPEDWLLYFAENIVDKFGFTKVVKIIAGGKNRQDSVFAGLRSLETDVTHVAIHDAVRPFVGQASLNEVLRTGKRTGAAILAVPAKDTLKQVKNGVVEKTLDRSKVWLVQTPQVFERGLIFRAYTKAFEDEFSATDDSALVERMQTQVHIVPGAASNLKITTPEDLVFAKYLLTQKKNLK